MADKRLDSFLDICSNLAIGALTAITVTPWASLFVGAPIGAVAGYAARKAGLTKKARNLYYLNSERLKAIGAGKVDRQWREAKP
ncbi:MAG: hypothetical protein A2V70_08830 [Planctomycetes bacterium RBG_13_63_9]|nr:MAG: hypothetical protein A2V70_08830 [Planctomycetes bacterium RBG_13_63_9]